MCAAEFEPMAARDRWSLRRVWSLNSDKLFTGPSAVHAFYNERKTFQNPVQAIGVLQLANPACCRKRTLREEVKLHRTYLQKGLTTDELVLLQ